MHDLATTQDKLLKTPSGDVHSPFYRKLVSAGYKGHLGGAFGGGALYGSIGLGIGILIGGTLAFTTAGASALLLIPLITAGGIWHGVKTFSEIGTTAAIIAESAEIREKRQHLLDRFHETTNQEERKEIQKLLDEQVESKPPERMFHWKTLLLGALVGAVIATAIAFVLPAAMAFLHVDLVNGLTHLPEGLGKFLFEGTGVATKLTWSGIATFAAIGTTVGSFIGLDREYVRRWLDHSENLLNDPSHSQQSTVTKAQEVQRLSDAAQRDNGTIAVETIAEPKQPTTPDSKVHQVALAQQRAAAVAQGHSLKA